MKHTNLVESLNGIEEITAAVNKLVQRQGLTAEMVISRIEESLLSSSMPISDSSQAPLAYVDFNQYGLANLVLHVCRMGSYLTRGREEFRILIDHRDNTVQQAVDLLFDSNPGTSTSINLGDNIYTFDSLLKFDVYTALMDYLGGIRSDKPVNINEVSAQNCSN